MTTTRDPIPGLRGLSNAQIVVDVESYLKSFTPAMAEERAESLRKTFGCLTEEEGKAFEEALAESRKIDA